MKNLVNTSLDDLEEYVEINLDEGNEGPLTLENLEGENLEELVNGENLEALISDENLEIENKGSNYDSEE